LENVQMFLALKKKPFAQNWGVNQPPVSVLINDLNT
jgi:hypothetical protein